MRENPSIQDKYGEASDSSVANNKSLDEFLDDDLHILAGSEEVLNGWRDDELSDYYYLMTDGDPFFGD